MFSGFLFFLLSLLFSPSTSMYGGRPKDRPTRSRLDSLSELSTVDVLGTQSTPRLYVKDSLPTARFYTTEMTNRGGRNVSKMSPARSILAGLLHSFHRAHQRGLNKSAPVDQVTRCALYRARRDGDTIIDRFLQCHMAVAWHLNDSKMLLSSEAIKAVKSTLLYTGGKVVTKTASLNRVPILLFPLLQSVFEWHALATRWSDSPSSIYDPDWYVRLAEMTEAMVEAMERSVQMRRAVERHRSLMSMPLGPPCRTSSSADDDDEDLKQDPKEMEQLDDSSSPALDKPAKLPQTDQAVPWWRKHLTPLLCVGIFSLLVLAGYLYLRR